MSKASSIAAGMSKVSQFAADFVQPLPASMLTLQEARPLLFPRAGCPPPSASWPPLPHPEESNSFEALQFAAASSNSMASGVAADVSKVSQFATGIFRPSVESEESSKVPPP